MAIQNQPGFIPAPFANSGTKNVIPETMPTPSASAAASWTDGFPTVCSLPLASGGIPPARADFNGLFNSITQAQAFYQSGGVYEWDATVDYGTNRMVLGSDGKLYWSMAQSGPNIAAGAQDPTTDDGTYWGAIPANTPSVLDRSGKLVSSQWVEDAFGTASLYVDPATGDDLNDGLTSATAVKTIAKAVSLIRMRTGTNATVYLASGSYTENVDLYRINISFEILGNVSISGYLRITAGATIWFGGNYTIEISSAGRKALYIGAQSYVSFGTSQIKLSATNTDSVVGTGQNSAIFFGGSLTVSGTNISGAAIHISGGSGCAFAGDVSLVSNGCYAGLYIDRRSYCSIEGSFVETGSFGGGRGFSASVCSGVVIAAPGTHTFYDRFSVDKGSCVSVTANMNLICNDGSACLDLSNGGIYFQSTGDLSIRNTTSSGWTLLSCDTSSVFTMISRGTLSFNAPAVTHTVYCSRQSLIYVNESPTVTGTVSSGSRYRATVGGTISTVGRGPNLFPGSTAGLDVAGDYALYL